MKQYEAVIKVMENNGGYATLGHLYENVLKVKGCEWKTQTPFASMRRIVQDERFFFKIRPGLWALKSYRNKLPDDIKAAKQKKTAKTKSDHYYYQGLAVQIGNIRKFHTFVPAQDKNKNFLGNQKLGSLATTTKIYPFCYPNIINKTRTIDVVWFNSRKLPDALFEIEHSTDIKNSLTKFVELQDFRTKMFIVADEKKERLFNNIASLNAFSAIKDYVKFISYNNLANWYSKSCEISAIEKNIFS